MCFTGDYNTTDSGYLRISLWVSGELQHVQKGYLQMLSTEHSVGLTFYGHARSRVRI